MRQFFKLESNPAITDMAGAYSGQKFIVQPAVNELLFIPDIMFTIRTTSASETLFGNIPALTNGIDVFVETQNEDLSWSIIQDLVEIPIKSNLDFLDYTDNFQTVLSSSGSVVAIQAKLVFEEKLRISEPQKQRLSILISDDLTGAGTFKATIQRNSFRR